VVEQAVHPVLVTLLRQIKEHRVIPLIHVVHVKKYLRRALKAALVVPSV